MEINYETIIKYLGNIKPKEELNISQKNIYTYLKNISSKFQDLFCDKIYKYGITIYDNNKNNISFWSSLLTLIYKQFIVPFNEDELSYINKFKKELIDIYPIKYSISKNEIFERLKLEPDYILIQYIVDMLDINIIIFDFKEELIYSLYKNNMMNPLKPTYLFSYNNTIWEPIMLNSNNIVYKDFSYNDNLIKKILYSNMIIYYDTKKEFIVNDNINIIIDNEHNLLNKETNELFIKNEPNINENKLNKMTKLKLIEHAQSLNITINMSKMLKIKIIELIMNKNNI